VAVEADILADAIGWASAQPGSSWLTAERRFGSERTYPSSADNCPGKPLLPPTKGTGRFARERASPTIVSHIRRTVGPRFSVYTRGALPFSRRAGGIEYKQHGEIDRRPLFSVLAPMAPRAQARSQWCCCCWPVFAGLPPPAGCWLPALLLACYDHNMLHFDRWIGSEN